MAHTSDNGLWLVSEVKGGTGVHVVLQQWGCWVRCACVRTDVAGCAVRTCGWTPCCGRPGSAGSWFSWSPQSRPLPCLPSPPRWIKSWLPRERSVGHFPPILTSASGPLTACPPDTPSQPTTGKACCVRTKSVNWAVTLTIPAAGDHQSLIILQRWQPRHSVLGIHWRVLPGQYCSRKEGDRENNSTAQPVRCGDCCLQHCSTYNASQSLTVTGRSLSSVSLLNGLSAVQSHWSRQDSSLSRLQAAGLKWIVKLSNVYFDAHKICWLWYAWHTNI